MNSAKSASVPLAVHFLLSKTQSPSTESEINDMQFVPYSNAIGFVMYLMVCTRPDIAYAGVELIRYVDSNFSNDRDNRKSTTSYVFTLCGSCISWKSQLQRIVALSTTEAEYIAATEAIKEAIWLKGILKEIGFFKGEVVVYSDSQSGIQLCKNPVFHGRTKHIQIKYHFIRKIVDRGKIRLEKIQSEFNPADMGTKCLPIDKFRSCLKNPNFETKG
ncbi:hypothetical protein ABFS83_12G056700 [Erythranthe nasuta]